jgi:hypothetical protein
MLYFFHTLAWQQQPTDQVASRFAVWMPKLVFTNENRKT